MKLADNALQFMQVLWSLDHALMTRSKRMETTLGVTGPQRLVIRLISDHPGISAGTLAATLKFHPSTITGVLRRLQAARLIRRRADPADGRRVLVDLTPFGKTVSERTDGTIEDGVRRALRKASARDIDATRRVLTAIARELDDSRSGREASTPATGVDS